MHICLVGVPSFGTAPVPILFLSLHRWLTLTKPPT